MLRTLSVRNLGCACLLAGCGGGEVDPSRTWCDRMTVEARVAAKDLAETALTHPTSVQHHGFVTGRAISQQPCVVRMRGALSAENGLRQRTKYRYIIDVEFSSSHDRRGAAELVRFTEAGT